MTAPYWLPVSPTNWVARGLADRHYSRVRPGTRRFTPPAHKTLILLGSDGLALWVSQWPLYRQQPGGGLRPERVYTCNLFRNEGHCLSSSLIVDAVMITHAAWGSPVYWLTWVNPTKIRPTTNPGFCFIAAGWHRLPLTPRGLLPLRMVPPTLQDSLEL